MGLKRQQGNFGTCLKSVIPYICGVSGLYYTAMHASCPLGQTSRQEKATRNLIQWFMKAERCQGGVTDAALLCVKSKSGRLSRDTEIYRRPKFSCGQRSEPDHPYRTKTTEARHYASLLCKQTLSRSQSNVTMQCDKEGICC